MVAFLWLLNVYTFFDSPGIISYPTHTEKPMKNVGLLSVPNFIFTRFLTMEIRRCNFDTFPTQRNGQYFAHRQGKIHV